MSRGGHRREHSVSISRDRERARERERYGKERDSDTGADEDDLKGMGVVRSPSRRSATEVEGKDDRVESDAWDTKSRRLAALDRERARELQAEAAARQKLSISYTAPCTPIDSR